MKKSICFATVLIFTFLAFGLVRADDDLQVQLDQKIASHQPLLTQYKALAEGQAAILNDFISKNVAYQALQKQMDALKKQAAPLEKEIKELQDKIKALKSEPEKVE